MYQIQQDLYKQVCLHSFEWLVVCYVTDYNRKGIFQRALTLATQTNRVSIVHCKCIQGVHVILLLLGALIYYRFIDPASITYSAATSQLDCPCHQHKINIGLIIHLAYDKHFNYLILALSLSRGVKN